MTERDFNQRDSKRPDVRLDSVLSTLDAFGLQSASVRGISESRAVNRETTMTRMDE